jgi:hypothetical protein
MKYYMQRIKLVGLEPLVCDVGGRSNFDTAIHSFSGRAYVMASIDCYPYSALQAARFFIRREGLVVGSRETPYPEPYDLDIPAGQYDIEARFDVAAFASKVCPQLMQPPFTPCTVEVDS